MRSSNSSRKDKSMDILRNNLKLTWLLLLLPLAVLFIATTAMAQPSQYQPQTTDTNKTITLKDGTKIKGQVIGFQNGVYTIQSTHFGQIAIKDSEITSISSTDLPPANNYAQTLPNPNVANGVDPNAFKAQAVGLQQKLLNDPQNVADIQTLTSDPQFLELMNDKEFVSAIQNYDLEKIKSNPKTQMLMSNPQIQKIMQRSIQQNQMNNQ